MLRRPDKTAGAIADAEIRFQFGAKVSSKCAKVLRHQSSVLLLGILAWSVAGSSSVAMGDDLDGLAVAAALERVFIHAIEQAEPSIVSIARIRRHSNRNPFEERPAAPFPPLGEHAPDPEDPDDPDFMPNDFGAGILIGSDGPSDKTPRRAYVLTNYHVVKGGTVEGQEKAAEASLHVRLWDRTGCDARILAADPRSDLAVLVIEAPNVRPIKFGDASKLKKGQLVLALGNPYAIARDGSASVSWGMISNISRRPQPPRTKTGENSKEETIHHLGNLLQVDTRLNLGTSGGALVNMQGELIGITTSLAALAGYEKSVGYAVPVDEATLRIIKTLREGKEVEYGFLGISFQRSGSGVLAFAPKVRTDQGVHEFLVMPDSPASRGGLRNGDLILEVNGKRIFSRIDLTREIGKLPPEEKAILTVSRERYDKLQLTIELGKWPVRDEEGIIAMRRRFEPWRGLVVDYPSARDKYVPRIPIPNAPSFLAAVLVTESLPQSPAAQADLEPGSLIKTVNGKAVATPGQFYETVKGLSGEVTLQLIDGRQVTVKAQ